MLTYVFASLSDSSYLTDSSTIVRQLLRRGRRRDVQDFVKGGVLLVSSIICRSSLPDYDRTSVYVFRNVLDIVPITRY
ncbi:hypothetical protein [Bacillus cereus]|uniref:hypothetical protein n=1 Tax=Bacillus cereus TaxID=1396 RepID=UPI0015D477EC|nr:hypothetical protein [Bacillus cereus]